MPFAARVVTAAQQVDQTDYAPGLIAFLVIFALAISCWLLFRSMSKHIRTANRNEQQREAAHAEKGTASTSRPPASDDGGTPAA